MLTRALGEGRWLRLFEERDADELYAVVDANRDYLSRWMPWSAAQTREATLEFIRASRRQLAENQGVQLAIIDSDRIVGTIGYHRLDWQSGLTSLGYWIAEHAQGRGTVTAAAAALVDHAFDVWNFNRIEIRAGIENRRSRAIPERLGFREEGVQRQAERINGRWIDHVVYAVLADDWRARKFRDEQVPSRP